jgi:hypothetical protein
VERWKPKMVFIVQKCSVSEEAFVIKEEIEVTLDRCKLKIYNLQDCLPQTAVLARSIMTINRTYCFNMSKQEVFSHG